MRNELALLVCLCGAALATPAFGQGHNEGIDKVRAEWSQSFQSKQIDNLMALYSEQASLLLPDGQRVKGSADIRAYFQKQFDSAQSLKIELKSDESEAAKDLGFDSGQYAETIGRGGMSGVTIRGVTVSGTGGQETHRGNYLVVLKQINGSWLIFQQAVTEAVPIH